MRCLLSFEKLFAIKPKICTETFFRFTYRLNSHCWILIVSLKKFWLSEHLSNYTINQSLSHTHSSGDHSVDGGSDRFEYSFFLVFLFQRMYFNEIGLLGPYGGLHLMHRWGLWGVHVGGDSTSTNACFFLRNIQQYFSCEQYTVMRLKQSPHCKLIASLASYN